MRLTKPVLLAALVLMPVLVFAQSSAADLVNTALNAGMATVLADMQTLAIRVLSALVAVQFVVTHVGTLKSDWDALWAKFLGSLLWFTFCWYVMDNGVDFLRDVAQFFVNKAGDVSGGDFDAGYVMSWGITLQNNLVVAFNQATGADDSILAAMKSFLPAIMMAVCCFIILACSALIACKIFIVKIEMGLVVAVAPLSFALLGLNALRDQGIAPFKYLIAVVYRIMILAIIVAGMTTLGEHIKGVFKDIATVDNATSIWTPVFGAVFGYVLLAFLAFKSDSIASSIAAGSSNLSSGDASAAAAVGAAAGAAAGAAVAGAPGAARETLGAAKDVGRGAGGVLDRLAAAASPGGGTVRNVSGAGTGGGSAGGLGVPPAAKSAANPNAAPAMPVGNGRIPQAAAAAAPAAGGGADGGKDGNGGGGSGGDSAAPAAMPVEGGGGGGGNGGAGGASVPAQPASSQPAPDAMPAGGVLGGAEASPAPLAPDLEFGGGAAPTAAPSGGAGEPAAALPGPEATPVMPDAAALGSGATAGISGADNRPDEAKAPQRNPADRNKPTLGDHLNHVNSEVRQVDPAATSVSINAHVD